MANGISFDGRGRLLAVGDVHGCLNELRELMSRVKPTAEDRIVFLGDYIDRGPDARGVIDYLLDFGERFPATVFLKGNHEAMFLDYLAGREQMLFIYNGGQSTLRSYQEKGAFRIPRHHLDFLHGLPPCHVTEGFVFVHAGLRPGVSLEKQQEQDMLWIRDEFIRSDHDWGKTVVFGHTPLTRPLWEPNKIGIDTGCVYGRVLTCCDVRERCCWTSG